MYTHTQYEVRVGEDVALDSTGDKADWSAGYVPHAVRAAAIVLKGDPAGGSVVKIDKRPTAGSDTSRGDGDVAVINIPNAAQGDVIFADGLNVELKPGEEAVVEVTAADGTASLTGHVVLYVEPRWELPGNVSALIESV